MPVAGHFLSARRDDLAALELESELVSEVDVLDLLVCQDGFSVAFGDQLAIVDNVGDLADVQSIPHVVIGNQHADTFALEVMNDLFDIAYRDRIDTRKRLIEQNELGRSS